MAKELEITGEYGVGLYDSATSESCATEKVVDVTEDCPRTNDNHPCIFLYTRAQRGRIIQIFRPYEKYIGRRIHFFVDELDAEMNVSPDDDIFGMCANELGLEKSTLRSLIEVHTPAA